MSQIRRNVIVDSLSKQVYEDLRHRILYQDLKPGAPLQPLEISQEYGVSTTPVKDALRLLERDGLVTIRPRSGTSVSVLDTDTIADDFDARLMMELYAVENGVPHISDEEVEYLRRIADEIEEIQSPDNATMQEELLLLEQEFHFALVRLLHNRRIETLYDGLQLHWRTMRVSLALDPEYTHEVRRPQHEAIIAACARRDAEAAKEAVREHILVTQRRILDSIARRDAIEREQEREPSGMRAYRR
jgi:GntR family transcriptional regulator, rspAB operon transcriptional repressor